MGWKRPVGVVPTVPTEVIVQPAYGFVRVFAGDKIRFDILSSAQNAQYQLFVVVTKDNGERVIYSGTADTLLARNAVVSLTIDTNGYLTAAVTRCTNANTTGAISTVKIFLEVGTQIIPLATCSAIGGLPCGIVAGMSNIVAELIESLPIIPTFETASMSTGNATEVTLSLPVVGVIIGLKGTVSSSATTSIRPYFTVTLAQSTTFTFRATGTIAQNTVKEVYGFPDIGSGYIAAESVYIPIASGMVFRSGDTVKFGLQGATSGASLTVIAIYVRLS